MEDTVDLTTADGPDLAAARGGDQEAFARLVQPHRRDLHAHCYRMLGSVHDADDALQDALLGVWRGLAGFEGRSSVRSWLYRIATNAALRVAERRPRRQLGDEQGPPHRTVHDLGEPVTGPVFVEPYPDSELVSTVATADPEARYERLESVELAFVGALQALPATQRAVLILRDVLAFPATETADCLDTTVASVTSALQRARRTMDDRLASGSQQEARRALGDDGQRQLVDAFVAAWEGADIDALVALLAEDARFTMPPLPAWFDGRDDVAAFFAERIFATPWRLVPTSANGQLALACYQDRDGAGPELSAVNVLAIRGGQITEIAGFIEPAAYAPFGLPRHPPS